MILTDKCHMADQMTLIVCDSEHEKPGLEKRMRGLGFEPAFITSSEVETGIPSNLRPVVVLHDCELLKNEQLLMLFHVSDQLPRVPIVVLARQISVEAYRQVASMENMVTLQKPFLEPVFESLIKKLTSDEPLLTRFPRFITDEPVRMVVLKNGLLIPTRMKNYSAGGAFLQYNGISLKVGDKLQVNLSSHQYSNRLENSFQIQAKVVWVKDDAGPRSPARGVGIQFLNM